ncbi:MAG: hypothetical protein V2A63_04940 [Patescibacteria group bacterium]
MTTYTSRLRKGANIRFGLAAGILFIAAIFLIWPNYKQLVQDKTNISELNKQLSSSELELDAERNQYRLLKNEYGLEANTSENTIATILPEKADETDIVRMLEQRANELGGEEKSLILDSVNIGSPSPIKDVDHLSLPIKINLVGTKDKLLAFIRYLEKTGLSTTDDQATRLIDIQDVNMQIDNRANTNEIKVQISANAYILPSPEEIALKEQQKQQK